MGGRWLNGNTWHEDPIRGRGFNASTDVVGGDGEGRRDFL